MKLFRALIFDVDGTLAETEEVHRRAFVPASPITSIFRIIPTMSCSRSPS
jgi:phosphoglycolate phosphatase-like HAD superfamily hydrolase